MRIKIIKNKNEYDEALAFFENLMLKEEELTLEETEQLELLAKLLEDYEDKNFETELPDPIEAIKFRMEQQGLSNQDLVPFIGSKSKVSEVLSGKRPLSLNMIRSLQDGLGIPSEILLNQKKNLTNTDVSYDVFPIKEMEKRGYIQISDSDTGDSILSKVQSFLAPIFQFSEVKALLSKATYVRTKRPMDSKALAVWIAKVILEGQKKELNKFNPESLSTTFLKDLIKLSNKNDGILEAINSIENIGIPVIVEPDMPKTYLDGAAIMLDQENPIIGLTLRLDRLDNLWFTLLHELAHVKLHIGKGFDVFIDSVESTDQSAHEEEADSLASEIIVPNELWAASPVKILPTPETVKIFADQLGVHPALVAGKARFLNNNYQILNDLVGNGEPSKILKARTNINN